MTTSLRSFTRLVLAAFSLTFAACDTGAPEDDAEIDRQAAQDELRGTWASGCFNGSGDPEQPAWTQATFVNEGDQGSFTLTMYGDEACEFALAAFTLDSDQHVGELVIEAGEGVRELDIAYRRITATAFVPDMAAAFEGSGCGTDSYVLGEPVDISETGCFDLAPISECPGDYDIMLVDGDTFYNGVRTDNMCEAAGRPRELNVFPFARQ